MAYINKEDLLATINEVWERKYAKCEWKTLYDLYRMCVRRINRAQVADVVQVVRCKDCEYFYQDGNIKACKHWNCHSTTDDAYCSYAKKKGDE